MMAMPNRSVEVATLCAQHPEAFPPGDQNDSARLAFLKAVIIPTLNKLDGGQWGFMTKTDQRLGDGFKVPCDVMMWRPTNDVVDCMTGTGGCWITHDPPPPAWVWTAVDPIPHPDPDPHLNPNPNIVPDVREQLLAVEAKLEAHLHAIEVKLDQILARQPPDYTAALPAMPLLGIPPGGTLVLKPRVES